MNSNKMASKDNDIEVVFGENTYKLLNAIQRYGG